MTAIISFISASQLGQERLDKDFASTIVDLFYRQHFASTTPVIKSLGSCGGFSGARFWRIEDASHVWCLRRWPQAACEDENRLLWIHRQLALAHAKGCFFLPVPLFSNTRETLVEYGDHLWQMERWMPGTADYHRLPSQARLAAAIKTLATFHRALQTDSQRCQPSPGIQQRLKRLSELHDGRAPTDGFYRLKSATEAGHADPEFRSLAAHLIFRFLGLAGQLHQRLLKASQVSVPIQTVIADIWHDHVLFSGDEVSGFVDFGAMRMDTMACDIARLLGSLVPDQPAEWKWGLDAWCSKNQLSPAEHDLIALFDDSTIVLSGLNWLQWICLENRQFGDLKPITKRLRTISLRMDFMASKM